MSLERSIEEIITRLSDWAGFPKYSLERRVDIFLTPFLAPFLSSRMEDEVRLVAPEFPIKKDGSNQSVNLDYLLRRGGRTPAWIFLELKTDAASVGDEQLRLYREARSKGMPALVAEIEQGILPATKGAHNKRRYQHLLEQLAMAGSLDAPIEILYLSPKAPGPGARWISLKDFSSWTPSDHVELWRHLKPLLLEIQANNDLRSPQGSERE